MDIRRDSNISPNSGGVPSTVAMLLERRNGPRRLHDIDDDYDDDDDDL